MSHVANNSNTTAEDEGGAINAGQSGPVHLQTMTPTYTLAHTLLPTLKRSLPCMQTQKTPDYLVSFLFSPLTPSLTLAHRQGRLFGSIKSLFRVRRQSNVN